MGWLLSLPVQADPEGEAWRSWGAPVALRLLDCGNHRQALELGRAYQAYLRETGQSSTPADLYCAEVALQSGLLPNEVEPLRQWARAMPSPEQELAYLNALLLQAAQRAGQPELEREHELALRASLSGLQEEQQAVFRFLLETQGARQILRAAAEPDWDRMVLHHQRAWTALSTFHPTNQRNRLWVGAGGFWLTFWRRAQSNGFHAEEAGRFFAEDSRQLLRLGQEACAQQSYTAFLGICSLQAQLMAEWLGRGQARAAQAQAMVDLSEGALELSQAQLGEDESVLQSTLPSALRARLGEGFRLDLGGGDLPTLRARVAVLRLYLAEDAPVAILLETIRRSSRSANELLGHQGLDDPRWEALSALSSPELRRQLLQELRDDNARVGYRPGVIWAWARQGELERDVTALSTAIDLLEDYLNELGGGAGVKAAYHSTYELLARLLSEQGRAEEAMTTVARQGNLLAFDLGSRALADQPEAAVSRRAVSLEKSLALGLPAADQLLADNRRELNRALGELRQLHPRFDALTRIKPVELGVWQELLPPDTTVVQYFPCEDALYVFVMSRDQLKMRRVEVALLPLRRSILELRHLLTSVPNQPELAQFSWSDPRSAGFERHTRPLQLELRRLYDWLIRPLEEDLGERPVLAIIPSGPLHYVPFPALMSGLEAGQPDFLVHRRRCLNLVRAASLAELKKPPEKTGSLLALANPDGSLPGAAREARAIAALFPAAVVRLGREATSQSLASIPAGTGYLHLATHGQLVDPVRGYLVLADRRFELADIFKLELPSLRLVGLSACETALGQALGGSELVSLALAFSTAGGRAVLASLWSVSDEGTERLMVEFYGQLRQGKTLAEALQQAQWKMLAQPALRHPYFWAAFPLYGDWR